MKNFSTWLVVMFMGLFWILRVAVALAYEFNTDIAGITPLNQTFEIVLLFATLLSMVLIVKRKTLGAIFYIATYFMYFLPTVISGISTIAGGGVIDPGAALNTFVAVIGLVIPIVALLDLLFDKSRMANPQDKKTDWFYKNEQFDREIDERADKNNYRTM